MAHNFLIAGVVKNAELDALSDQLDGGFIDILDGSQPATPETAITTQVVLGTLGCNATFSPAASGGVLTANSMTADSDADATGIASWFRAYKSDHTTAVSDGTVGTTSSFDLVINSTSISIHSVITPTSMTITY